MQGGREALHVYEQGRDVHMRINYIGFSVKDEEKARENAPGSDGGPYQSLNGTGGQFNRDVTASRYLAIRTRFGDDFFEDCTRPTRNIKQVNRYKGPSMVKTAVYTVRLLLPYL